MHWEIDIFLTDKWVRVQLLAYQTSASGSCNLGEGQSLRLVDKTIVEGICLVYFFVIKITELSKVVHACYSSIQKAEAVKHCVKKHELGIQPALEECKSSLHKWEASWSVWDGVLCRPGWPQTPYAVPELILLPPPSECQNYNKCMNTQSI